MLSFQSTKYAILFKLVNNKIRIDLDKDLKWQKQLAVYDEDKLHNSAYNDTWISILVYWFLGGNIYFHVLI